MEKEKGKGTTQSNFKGSSKTVVYNPFLSGVRGGTRNVQVKQLDSAVYPYTRECRHLAQRL